MLLRRSARTVGRDAWHGKLPRRRLCMGSSAARAGVAGMVLSRSARSVDHSDSLARP